MPCKTVKDTALLPPLTGCAHGPPCAVPAVRIQDTCARNITYLPSVKGFKQADTVSEDFTEWAVIKMATTNRPARSPHDAAHSLLRLSVPIRQRATKTTKTAHMHH
jgi:hypothetical protein